MKYQVGLIKKRLNQRGRGLFATKMKLQGMSETNIAYTLGIKQVRLKRLYGATAGILGLYPMFTDGMSGEDIINGLSDDGKHIVIAQIDIIIASKGDKLFTSSELPKQRKKETI